MSPNVKTNSVPGIIGTILISSPFAILGVGKWKGLVRNTMKNINYRKAKDFKLGDRVRDLGISFIVKEVRVVTGEPGLISFLDTEDVWHGSYHPDEYFGVGEELARKHAATYNRQIEEEIYRLANMPSEMIH